MTQLLFLIPVALFLGGLSIFAFLWALRGGQYDDLDGAAHRVLLDDAAPSRAGEAPSGGQNGPAR